MRPERSSARAFAARTSAILALAVALAGCGREESRQSTELSFEELSDTAGLSQGRPLLTTFEPYRLQGGAMRVRGAVDFPDGTRLQVAVARAADGQEVARLQVSVENRTFETPPFMGERGPLPEDLYRFTLLAHFNDTWQPPSVMSATAGGKRLRGPGIIRTSMGQASFTLQEERRL
jgi:hypothetical protein